MSGDRYAMQHVCMALSEARRTSSPVAILESITGPDVAIVKGITPNKVGFSVSHNGHMHLVRVVVYA